MWRVVLCVFLVAVALADEGKPSKVVITESGPVRGFQEPVSGIYEFFDIPYATAPTGTHKFRAPLPAPVWSQTRDAINADIMCPQAEMPPYFIKKTMDENCLLASVFVPDSTENKLPVVVYVHGGAFQGGYGNIFLPTDLVKDHNIIVVTFNYRLGVQGFLCLGTENIPGNAGMKDQVALLHWVKNNIASFSGNPDDVTIAGYSAGAAAVDLLMISKETTGLFNKVIPESGANNAAFAIQSDPLENAKWFASALKFRDVENIEALDQFYRTLSYEQLNSDGFASRTDSTFLFSPCVERSLTEFERAQGKSNFLDESPVEIMKKGTFKKVPLLNGFANMEGLLRIGAFDIWKDKMNEKFSDFLPADLKFESEMEKEKVAKSVKEFYFGQKSVDKDTVLSYIDYFTDVIFAYPALRGIKLQVEDGHDQIYLYEYSFVDELTPLVPYTNIRGANHGAQTFALFGKQILEDTNTTYFTEEFKQISSTLRQIWANFIKTGKPVPEGSDLPAWPPVSSRWSPHMSIGNVLKLQGSLLLERALFWDAIYSKHYKTPVPPSTYPAKHTEL